jgi:hypothetical protein
MRNEQKVTDILSCVPTHTPEKLLRMIMDLEDPEDIDYIIFHPSISNEVFNRMDELAKEWIGPIREENKRVQEELEREKSK